MPTFAWVLICGVCVIVGFAIGILFAATPRESDSVFADGNEDVWKARMRGRERL